MVWIKVNLRMEIAFGLKDGENVQQTWFYRNLVL